MKQHPCRTERYDGSGNARLDGGSEPLEIRSLRRTASLQGECARGEAMVDPGGRGWPIAAGPATGAAVEAHLAWDPARRAGEPT